MTRFDHFVRMCLLVVAATMFILAWLAILASFTIVPMMNNYRECGSIFLCDTLREEEQEN